MLPQSHFTKLNRKSKYFSNALRDSSIYVISCVRQLVTQELDNIHILHPRKFCSFRELVS